MAKEPAIDYKHLKAKYGKAKALQIATEYYKRKFPPKRERIVIP